MPISSLPSPYGIGSFGEEAYAFIDFLVEANQSLWQILPMGPTSYGDSPYQSTSAFAGNPYFIDLDLLVAEGLLLADDLKEWEEVFSQGPIAYEKLYLTRPFILEKAVEAFKNQGDFSSFKNFEEQAATWLDDFALYMSLKEYFNMKAWMDWPDQAAKAREEGALQDYREKLADRIFYHKILQFFFFQQWQNLKVYANQRGIKIVGDVPIYVATDSADVWANTQYFKLNEQFEPTCLAGCPPDAFSEDGQLWGNPIYNWEKLHEDNYTWWVQRLRATFSLYDLVRIDHFRGFEAYWEIPNNGEATSAVNGAWVKGPGLTFFEKMKDALGQLPIIAEDLGYLTPEVHELLAATGFPGMKVLQFAFGVPYEDNDYLLHHHIPNSAAYIGTHDNNTLLGWYLEELTQEQRDYCDAYIHKLPSESIEEAMIRALFSSASAYIFITVQDLLGLGSYARINTPSTASGNWIWRLTSQEKSALADTALYLAYWSKLYQRC